MGRESKPVRMAMLHQAIINPQSGAAPICSRVRHEFIMFVNKAWKELTLHETKDTGVKSSISIFCRMDVGIRIDPL